jgi:ketosteroid isomerase-like protein
MTTVKVHQFHFPRFLASPRARISRRLIAVLVFGHLSLFSGSARARSGPCTESAIIEGNITPAEDAFAYMPPYGKPVTGKSNIQGANNKSFSDRTNIKRSWADDHRIVADLAGQMAYERGTMQIGYDDKEGHHEFKAVVLEVFMAKGEVCQNVAFTMQPLDNDKKEAGK